MTSASVEYNLLLMNNREIIISFVWITAVAFVLCGCSSDHSPKPVGYPQFDFELPAYISFNDYAEFEFDLSTLAEIVPIADTLPDESFKIVYPEFNAQIYCGYTKTDIAVIAQMEKDALALLSVEMQRVGAFDKDEYENPEGDVYAWIYTLQGNTASPVQFYIIDRRESFFKGALYFDKVANRDSIAPVVDYLSRDIQVLIETFRWKK